MRWLQVFDSPELLWDVRVPGDCPFDFFIVGDSPGVDDFGQVEIDSEGNGDDVAKQNEITESSRDPGPVVTETSQELSEKSDEDHAHKQALALEVDFLVAKADFFIWIFGVHGSSALLPSINDESIGFPCGENSVSPQSVVESQGLSDPLSLEFPIKDSEELIDVHDGLVSFYESFNS